MKDLCTGQIKNVCIKENLEHGQHIYEILFNAIQKEAIRKIKLFKKAEKLRRIQQMKENRMLQMLRERFLDRHL